MLCIDASHPAPVDLLFFLMICYFQVGAFAVRIIDLKFQVLAGVFQFEGRVPSRVVGILLRLCPPNFLPTAAYFFKTHAHWVRLWQEIHFGQTRRLKSQLDHLLTWICLLSCINNEHMRDSIFEWGFICYCGHNPNFEIKKAVHWAVMNYVIWKQSH